MVLLNSGDIYEIHNPGRAKSCDHSILPHFSPPTFRAFLLSNTQFQHLDFSSFHKNLTRVIMARNTSITPPTSFPSLAYPAKPLTDLPPDGRVKHPLQPQRALCPFCRHALHARLFLDPTTFFPHHFLGFLDSWSSGFSRVLRILDSQHLQLSSQRLLTKSLSLESAEGLRPRVP